MVLFVLLATILALGSAVEGSETIQSSVQGMLLTLDMHSGSGSAYPTLYLRTDNYTVFTLAFDTGVEPFPGSQDTHSLRGARVTAQYYHAEGRTLHCNQPLSLTDGGARRMSLGSGEGEGFTESQLPRRLVYSVDQQLQDAKARTLPQLADHRRLQEGNDPLAGVIRPYKIAGKLPIIVYITSFCTRTGNLPPATTESALRQWMFDDEEGLDQMYLQCSGSKCSIDPDNTRIITVNIPCSGRKQDGSGRSWDTASCNNDQLWDWLAYADAQARARGIKLGNFYHKIFLLPKDHAGYIRDCNWAGLASTGWWSREPDTPESKLFGWGVVWLGGSSWNAPHAWFHEMGHNYWLSHAASTIDQPNGQICEYCDSTSAMGGVTGPRCYGGAHNWQLGWFEGLDEFPRTRLSATEAVAVDLPRQGRGPSAVRVWPTNRIQDALWISFRSNVGTLDRPFDDGVASVLVHRWPGNSYDEGFTLTVLVARLKSVGDSYTDPTGMTIKWEDADGDNRASVSVCLSNRCQRVARLPANTPAANNRLSPAPRPAPKTVPKRPPPPRKAGK